MSTDHGEPSALEVGQLLRSSWHPVARSRRLIDCEQFGCTLLGEPIVLEKDGDAMRAWWGNRTVTRRDAALPLAVEIWNGFVMVNVDANAQPLGDQISALTAHLAPYDLSRRSRLDLHEVTASWDWRLSMEHYARSYREGVLGHGLAEIIEVSSNGPGRLFYGRSRDLNRSHNIFPPKSELPDAYVGRVYVAGIFPALHLVVGAAMALCIEAQVFGAERHRLSWSLLLPDESIAVAERSGRLEHYREVMRLLLEDDVQVLALQAEGLLGDEERSGIGRGLAQPI